MHFIQTVEPKTAKTWVVKILSQVFMLVHILTAVSSDARAKLRDWASLAGRGRQLLSGSVAHASLKTAVC